MNLKLSKQFSALGQFWQHCKKTRENIRVATTQKNSQFGNMAKQIWGANNCDVERLNVIRKLSKYSLVHLISKSMTFSICQKHDKTIVLTVKCKLSILKLSN